MKKKKKKLTESNAHRPSFCCVQIKRHVWNIAAALKLGVYGRKGSCQSPKHGCHVGTLSQDSTLWQGSNKYCLPIPAYSATPKDTPAPTAIHTGEGQEFQLQEFVSSQSVLLHGHQQCTLALYAQHHDAITDAIGTMNLSWSQYPRHAGFAAHIHCPMNVDYAVIKAVFQDRLLGSVLVALAAMPRTVLCQKQRRGQTRYLCFVQCAQPQHCAGQHIRNNGA